jgi:predicted secreted hydrolase
MVFQVRQRDGKSFVSGNWLSEDGLKKDFSPKMVKIKVKKTRKFKDYLIPTSWEVIIPKKKCKVTYNPYKSRGFHGNTGSLLGGTYKNIWNSFRSRVS